MSTEEGQQPTMAELWDVVQQQRAELEQLRAATQRRRGIRLPRIGAGLRLAVSIAVALSMAAAGGAPLRGLPASLASNSTAQGTITLNHGHAHMYPRKGLEARNTNSVVNLRYWGGPIMPLTHTYAIFWQPSGYHFDTSDSAYENLQTRFLSDVGGSSLYNILTQYPSSSQTLTNSSSFVTSVTDTNAFPASACATGDGLPCLTETQIQNELTSVVNAHSWSASSSNLFFIFTPLNMDQCFNDGTTCTTNSFCAYHDYISGFNGGASSLMFADMPDAGGSGAGCLTGSITLSSAYPNGDPAADSEISIDSHEMSEAVTDPQPNGWGNTLSGWVEQQTNAEIGDECAWDFGTIAPDGSNITINGHKYIVQQEWSNANDNCVLSYGNSGGGSVGSNVTLITPTRVLDTRFGVGAPKAQVCATSNNASSSIVTLSLAGHNGIPSNATGVVGTLRAYGPNGAGTLTMYPGAGTPPVASNLNFVNPNLGSGVTMTSYAVSDFVMVGLVNGQASILVGGPLECTDIVFDVSGYIA